jgi:hypothetical protein
MWPTSGYEASPFSPAGQAQAEWRFLSALGNRGSRGTRLGVRVALLAIVAALILGPAFELINFRALELLTIVLPGLLVIGLLTWFFGRMLQASEHIGEGPGATGDSADRHIGRSVAGAWWDH